MEKSKFDQVNGSAGPAPEAFSIRDNATGRIRAVRDMTDQELARYVSETAQQLQMQTELMRNHTNAVIQVSGFMSVLRFEADRRQRAIEIVPALAVQ